MNSELCKNWNGFSASVPGNGHIRLGLPCQDASAAFTSPRPALIVCDGRGSASASQDGANAAVRAFRTQVSVFEPMLSSLLDVPNPSEDQWQVFVRIMYRTLMQVKLDLSEERELPEKEFDFTVAFAIVGTCHIGCFQVGDGTIVLRQNGQLETAFLPDKGEFANQTHFLREDGEASGKYHTRLYSAHENTGIAITSDGPQFLMFQLADMRPGRIFGKLLDDLHEQQLIHQDIMDYLTRREWGNDPRGADDRSLAILAPVVNPDTVEMPEAPQDKQPEGTPVAEADVKPDTSSTEEAVNKVIGQSDTDEDTQEQPLPVDDIPAPDGVMDANKREAIMKWLPPASSILVCVACLSLFPIQACNARRRQQEILGMLRDLQPSILKLMTEVGEPKEEAAHSQVVSPCSEDQSTPSFVDAMPSNTVGDLQESDAPTSSEAPSEVSAPASMEQYAPTMLESHEGPLESSMPVSSESPSESAETQIPDQTSSPCQD